MTEVGIQHILQESGVSKQACSLEPTLVLGVSAMNEFILQVDLEHVAKMALETSHR